MATQSFDNAARALNIDWGTRYDGKQIQRWGEAFGRTLVESRQKELEEFQAGDLPPAPANEHQLLVIGGDGGRVQTREAGNDRRGKGPKLKDQCRKQQGSKRE